MMMSLTMTIIPYNIGDNAESQLVPFWNMFAVRSSCSEIPNNYNFLQFNTLHGATPTVQRCRPASLMMMTDHHALGVMPVSSSQRPQNPLGHGSRVVNAL